MVRKILLSALFFLAACTPVMAPADTPTPTIHGVLTPYYSPTPSQTTTPTTYVANTSTPVPPLASPTPLTHKVTAGESLGLIARNYGVTRESLIEANPSIKGQVLQIGTILVIPPGGILPTTTVVLPTPTMVPLATQGPVCYPSPEGGAWCVLLVTNTQSLPVEDLTASISLYVTQVVSPTSQVVSAALNLLRPGTSIPLLAYFAPPLPDSYSARGQVLTSLPVLAGDTRYLEANLEGLQIEIGDPALMARARGQVVLPAGSRPANQIWLAAVAYDAQGNAVGLRKFELEANCPGAILPGTLTPTPKPTGKVTPTATATALPCPPVPFDLTVYSLGPKIARVEILLEIR